MGLKAILGVLFLLFVVSSLALYWWMIPFSSTEFGAKYTHSNFSVGDYETLEAIQFYKNMRYPDSRISYKIDNSCTIQKKDDMRRAFEIIENSTILDFYSVEGNEEISVECDEKSVFKEGLFIAGEGGPSNITKTKQFNVILNGRVLLIRSSPCPNPNIALHELLHALGLNHSSNPKNIMYYLTSCDQTMGDDTINLLNQVYSVPSEAELSFENVSAIMHGRYMNTSFTIRNNGLADSEEIKLIIYADDELAKEFEVGSLEIGVGKVIQLDNIFIGQARVEKISLEIVTDSIEWDKENNKIVLMSKDKK